MHSANDVKVMSSGKYEHASGYRLGNPPSASEEAVLTLLHVS